MKVLIFCSTGLRKYLSGIQMCRQAMRTPALARKFSTLDPLSRESYQILSQIWRLTTMDILYFQTISNSGKWMEKTWLGYGPPSWLEKSFWKTLGKSLNLELKFRELLHATSHIHDISHFLIYLSELFKSNIFQKFLINCICIFKIFWIFLPA